MCYYLTSWVRGIIEEMIMDVYEHPNLAGAGRNFMSAKSDQEGCTGIPMSTWLTEYSSTAGVQSLHFLQVFKQALARRNIRKYHAQTHFFFSSFARVCSLRINCVYIVQTMIHLLSCISCYLIHELHCLCWACQPWLITISH